MDAQVRSTDTPVSRNGSGVRTDLGFPPRRRAACGDGAAVRPADPRAARGAHRARTLLRLAAPNVLVMFVQASIGLIETYFIDKLGTEALAGVALGVSRPHADADDVGRCDGRRHLAALARALGAGRGKDADALALHALVIGAAFGLVFTIAILTGGPSLYGAMGGSGGSLDAALTYSNVIFSGCYPARIFNSLAKRDTRNRQHGGPGRCHVCRRRSSDSLSPALHLRLGAFPSTRHHRRRGGGARLLRARLHSRSRLICGRGGASYALLCTWRRFSLAALPRILRVGAVAALITVQTNLTIAIATGLVGQLGLPPSPATARGPGSNTWPCSVPRSVSAVRSSRSSGTSIGAGQPERALRAAWIGAGIAAGLTEIIGLSAAAFHTPG